MSIIDKAASKRSGAGRSSLIDRAMSRGATTPTPDPTPAAGPVSPSASNPPAAATASAADTAAPIAPAASPGARVQETPQAVVRRRPASTSSRSFRPDWDELENQRLIGPSRHARRLQREIRTIKSRLMSSLDFFDVKRGTRGRSGQNLVLITSARQGEGKSFLAINLALSLALEDRIHVLLVDADAMQASVTKFFKIGSEEKGLLDRLVDPNMDLSDALWRAENSTLSVLPVGRCTASPTDLFGSPAMTRLLEELSNRYPDRLILFDAPPILATHDPMVLSKQIQQILMVVEAGKTTEATIRTALDVLGHRDRLSLVLNHCTIKGDEVQSMSYGYGHSLYQGGTAASRGQEAA
ncbi:MAG: AAA family ATPase [Tistlia sp.]|uniref:AAA family ATPase n=1 Tax=Tistlia sp. TaxID=3057121 RepID=UPI0034A0F393